MNNEIQVGSKVKFNHWGDYGVMVGIVEQLYESIDGMSAAVRISEGQFQETLFHPYLRNCSLIE